MKLILIAAVAVLALSAPVAMAADENAMMAPVTGFITDTGSGHFAKVPGYFTASQSVIDEFAPYHWSGPDAVKTWWAGFVAGSKAGGVTDVDMKAGKPTRILHEGGRGYIVVPAVLTMKVHGAPSRETGILTFALNKSKDGWKIASFAWAGDKPQP